VAYLKVLSWHSLTLNETHNLRISEDNAVTGTYGPGNVGVGE
jgi:hypothetical protein